MGFTGLTKQGETWCLTAGTRQSRVTQTTMTTLGDDGFHAVINEVGQNLTIRGHHDGARRDTQDDLSTICTVAVITLTRLAVAGTTMGTVMELKQ